MKSQKNIILNSDNDKNKQNETSFYRLIFVGDSGVGKTQIINIYNNKLFQNEHYPTFNIDFQIKTLKINGKKINIHCIDTEGSIDFTECTGKMFIKKADALIFVYDITSRQSFNNIDKYFNFLRFSLNEYEVKYNKKIIYIVGNKLDLRTNRLINENEGREIAYKYNSKYMECSAKNGLNVDRLFEYIIQDISKREVYNIIDSGGGNQKNNSIYKNIKSIRSNDNLKNNNINEFYSENNSGQNFETNSYFLKNTNYLNNDYINNINQNNEDLKKSFYYNQKDNNAKQCEIF